MFGGVLNSSWLGVRIVKRVPNNIEPITVSKLCRLVPLIRCQADGLATLTAFDFNAPNPGDRVAIAGLWIGWANAAHVKANLQVPNALALETTACLVGNDDILSGDFGLSPHLRVEIVEDGAELLFDGARTCEDQGGGDMADGAVLGLGQPLQACQALAARPFQIGEVVLGTLTRDGNFGFKHLPRPKVHNPVLRRSDTGVE